jgi:hypothetical protein
MLSQGHYEGPLLWNSLLACWPLLLRTNPDSNQPWWSRTPGSRGHMVSEVDEEFLLTMCSHGLWIETKYSGLKRFYPEGYLMVKPPLGCWAPVEEIEIKGKSRIGSWIQMPLGFRFTTFCTLPEALDGEFVLMFSAKDSDGLESGTRDKMGTTWVSASCSSVWPVMSKNEVI